MSELKKCLEASKVCRGGLSADVFRTMEDFYDVDAECRKCPLVDVRNCMEYMNGFLAEYIENNLAILEDDRK